MRLATTLLAFVMAVSATTFAQPKPEPKPEPITHTNLPQVMEASTESGTTYSVTRESTTGKYKASRIAPIANLDVKANVEDASNYLLKNGVDLTMLRVAPEYNAEGHFLHVYPDITDDLRYKLVMDTFNKDRNFVIQGQNASDGKMWTLGAAQKGAVLTNTQIKALFDQINIK